MWYQEALVMHKFSQINRRFHGTYRSDILFFMLLFFFCAASHTQIHFVISANLHDDPAGNIL